jgi:hypothetical protein
MSGDIKMYSWGEVMALQLRTTIPLNEKTAFLESCIERWKKEENSWVEEETRLMEEIKNLKIKITQLEILINSDLKEH